MGIDAKGNKHVLGLREGSTESTRVVRSLLSDLIERGLDADRARLWVIDGGKALRRAIVECFGAPTLAQRCQEHKRRNVIEHLPEELHASVGRALRDAWGSANAQLAKKQLQRLATSLQTRHPGGQPARGAGGNADFQPGSARERNSQADERVHGAVKSLGSLDVSGTERFAQARRTRWRTSIVIPQIQYWRGPRVLTATAPQGTFPQSAPRSALSPCPTRGSILTCSGRSDKDSAVRCHRSGVG